MSEPSPGSKAITRTRLDIIAGVALPLVLLVIDPAVFRDSGFALGGTILGSVKGGCYIATICFVIALAVRLAGAPQTPVLAGVLTAGFVFAICIGVALFPFSLLGAFFFGLGLLGLTPFLMAYVFGRNALGVFLAARVARPHRFLVPALTGFVLPLALGGSAQLAVNGASSRGLQEVASGEPGAMERGMTRLRLVFPLLDSDEIVRAYTREQMPDRRERIGVAYQRLTGGDVGTRAAILSD